ncbi:MAG TPA: heavy-metal-associated domain-containing protein [Chloroflexota bacterium]|nr:heavy-metal-associated domain-containing protein [Chloroflexota bacterium]
MEGESVEHVRLTSPDIDGAGDRDRIEREVSALEGVLNVTVQPNEHCALIDFDPRIVNVNRIEERLQDAGYHVSARQFASPRDNPE